MKGGSTDRILGELDLWDYPQIQLPVRSRLCHLPPVGINTPLVECFTSYIARLAAAHHVSVNSLISTEIKRFLPKNCSGSGDYNVTTLFPLAKALNGRGRLAQYWVEALEQLTLRHDLNILTMLKWRGILPSYGLMRSERSWCPNCYQEWFETARTVYEPLIWTIKAIGNCFQHNRRLVNECPFCGKCLPFLGSYYRVGHCSRCMKWLGNAHKGGTFTGGPYNQGGIEWQRWVTTNIGELLALPKEVSPPNKDRVAKTLTTLVSHCSKPTYRGLAEVLQLSSSELYRWCKGELLPQLNSILHICHSIGITLVDFLTKDKLMDDMNVVLGAFNTPLKIKKRVRHSPEPQMLKRQLEKILHSNKLPPLSMLAVGRQLKLHSTVLRRHFPEICREISAKYTQYRVSRRLENINLACEEAKHIILGLHAEGINPTQSRIRQRMSKCGYSRNEQVQHEIVTMKRKLGC